MVGKLTRVVSFDTTLVSHDSPPSQLSFDTTLVSGGVHHAEIWISFVMAPNRLHILGQWLETTLQSHDPSKPLPGVADRGSRRVDGKFIGAGPKASHDNSHSQLSFDATIVSGGVQWTPRYGSLLS